MTLLFYTCCACLYASRDALPAQQSSCVPKVEAQGVQN